jgi:UDPglucose 6-dehydrogenase
MSGGSNIYTISIIGLGLVGLTTAVVFSSRGARVLGIEEDNEKIIRINAKKPYFYEPKLEDMLVDVTNKGIFTVSIDIESAVRSSTISFITVGTPTLPSGRTNTSDLGNCAKEIGRALRHVDKYHLIVVKSTVPPGTTADLVGPVVSKYSGKMVGKDFGLACNPEFLREGSAINDSISPHMLLIGANDSRARRKLVSFYRSLFPVGFPNVVETNLSTAELIKYANNSYLATKISFINTMANICSRIPGVDVQVVSKAMGFDPRIGKLFLQAGPGYGGSCLPRDMDAFIHFAKSLGHNPILLRATQQVNEQQRAIVLEMVLKSLDGIIKKKRIAVLGTAFKKNTDDIRESVAVKLIRELKNRGSSIRVHDPMALDNTRKIFGDAIEYCRDIICCITGTECAVLMTDWDDYMQLDANVFKRYMKKANVIDARRILDYSKMKGLSLAAIGLEEKDRIMMT